MGQNHLLYLLQYTKVDKMNQLLCDRRKNRSKAPHAFRDACRAYSKVLKAKRSLENSKNIRKHERTFRNNPWLYAKCAALDKTLTQNPTSVPKQRMHIFKIQVLAVTKLTRQFMPSTDCDELIVMI